MVAPIADADTNAWEVMQWVREQGLYMPSPSHQVVLYYLTSNAFVEKDNPESAPLGQVLYAASHYSAIQAGTGIRTSDTVRKVLNALQDMAYVKRERRKGEGHRPLKIRVLWDQSMEEYRSKLRSGEVNLHPSLMERPVVRQKTTHVIPLRLVSTCQTPSA